MDGITLQRLGNLHLVFLHLPIGFVAAAVLLAWWCRGRQSEEGERLQGRLLVANAVAALTAAGLGLVLAATGGYDEARLMAHRWAGVACAGLSVVAWMTHVCGRRRAARCALAALLAVTIYAGHQGAALTHGPAAVAFWWRPQETRTAAKPATNASGAGVQQPAEIARLLEKRCLDCHGAKKSRGRLRLDDVEAAMKGGKSGRPALVPGKPEASELLRRIKLPRNDDEAMPPEEHEGLSGAEIAALEKWIASGAGRAGQ